MATKKKAKTYRGKSMKPGGGGRFAKMVTALKRKGKSAASAKKIAAAAGAANTAQSAWRALQPKAESEQPPRGRNDTHTI